MVWWRDRATQVAGEVGTFWRRYGKFAWIGAFAPIDIYVSENKTAAVLANVADVTAAIALRKRGGFLASFAIPVAAYAGGRALGYAITGRQPVAGEGLGPKAAVAEVLIPTVNKAVNPIKGHDAGHWGREQTFASGDFEPGASVRRLFGAVWSKTLGSAISWLKTPSAIRGARLWAGEASIKMPRSVSKAFRMPEFGGAFITREQIADVLKHDVRAGRRAERFTEEVVMSGRRTFVATYGQNVAQMARQRGLQPMEYMKTSIFPHEYTHALIKEHGLETLLRDLHNPLRELIPSKFSRWYKAGTKEVFDPKVFKQRELEEYIAYSAEAVKVSDPLFESGRKMLKALRQGELAQDIQTMMRAERAMKLEAQLFPKALKHKATQQALHQEAIKQPFVQNANRNGSKRVRRDPRERVW